MGTTVICPDLLLSSRANQCWEYSGLDSIEECQDKDHFNQYPYSITYNYNSRGFRDQEWPESIDDLKNSIWCIGDSFTVGLGSPLEHTWPWLLQKQTKRRVINISMDGASNNWISRRTACIQKEINPVNIVVMWSYLHRRESNNQSASDEERRLFSINSTDNDDAVNFVDCIEQIKNKNVIQLAIPEYSLLFSVRDYWENIRGTDWPITAPDTINELLALPSFIRDELKDHFKSWDKLHESLSRSSRLHILESEIIKVKRLDLARDGLHFDIITAQWVVSQIINALSQQN